MAENVITGIAVERTDCQRPWAITYRPSVQFTCWRNLTHDSHAPSSLREIKSFPSHKAYKGGADLRFLRPQPDTSLHCQTTHTELVHRAVCLFTSQLSLVPIAPTHGGMTRLSWPGWLRYIAGRYTCERSPVSVLTSFSIQRSSLMLPNDVTARPSRQPSCLANIKTL